MLPHRVAFRARPPELSPGGAPPRRSYAAHAKFPLGNNFNTNDVSYYYFRAYDQTGTFSPWTVASGHANGSCALL